VRLPFPRLLLPLVLLPGVARAQTASASDADRMTARALAHDGYEAQTHHQYAVAEDRFRRAESLVHAPTLELGLARAQVGLGKLVEAHETYRRIVREPLAPDAPAPFARAVADAGQELAALEPRLAWVTIDVRGAPPSDVTVSVDAAAFPSAALGIKRASDPGEHGIRASAPGFAPLATSFRVTEGQTTAISLTLQPAPSPEPAAVPVTEPPAATPPVTPSGPAPAEQPVPPPSTPFGKTAGMVALGLGVAGLAAGGVLGVLALTKHASLSGGCPDGHCAASESQQVSLYDTLATASTASLIAGAVGVATGFTLLLTTPKAAPVTAYAGFLSAGITARF
jgi:hypothetical protein